MGEEERDEEEGAWWRERGSKVKRVRGVREQEKRADKRK